MRRAMVALVSALVLVLAGCSTIPTSGPVDAGATEAPNGAPLVYVPNAPAVGANPQAIVTGFLTAASGGGVFAVAKQYLTDGFAKKWVPTTRVLVQGASATLSGSGADIRAQIPITATVDENGVYRSDSGTKPLTFHLVQQRGQWRIDSAPNGIVLTQPVFQTNYVPRQLEFFDPTWSRLVPDRRWFPSSRTGEGASIDPRSIVSALIQGPDGPLSGRVVANALSSTELVGILPSETGVLTVTLTAGRKPSATDASRMQQQMVQSLALPSPASLRLVVDGLVMPQAKAIADQLTSEAYVLTGGRFGTLSSSGAFTEDRTLGPQIAARKPMEITVSLGQKLAAVQTGSGEVDLVSPTGAKRVDPRSVVPPTLDQTGWVYSVPSTSNGGLQAANGKAAPVDLAVSLGDGTPMAIQVSPDGTRLLVLLDTPNGAKAYVAGIERDSSGAPSGLSTAHYAVDLGNPVGPAIGATWVDDGDVAIAVNGTDSDQVVTQQLGGLSGTLGQFANVTAIVGTTSTDDLRIRVQAGQTGAVYAWSQTEKNWQQQSATSSDISVLAVQR